MNCLKGENEYWTRDYDSFKFLEGNRDVGKYSEIANSIRDYGFVGSPIVVNEKFEIIDGQHRFLACKSIGAEFPFVIRRGAGIRECQILNEHGRNWTVKTYVESGIKLGNENAIRINKLYEKYGRTFGKEVVTSAAKENYMEKRYADISFAIKKGSFTLTESEYEKAVKAFEDMLSLVESVELVGMQDRRRIWYPLFFCHSLESVDFKHFVKNFKKYSLAYLKGLTQCDRIYEALTNIYRKGKKNPEEWVDFYAKYKEYQRVCKDGEQ